jgi:peptidoglycan/xylan/chitin deacetylase (PgdA/CDA1 family)
MSTNAYVPSPLLQQPAFRLPGGKNVGIWIGLHVEYWSLSAPAGSFVVKGIHGNWPDHFPDFRTHSFREYGNRVGIFRIFDVLARLGLPVTIIVNADAIRRYPAIIDEASRYGADFILQGRLANRMITSAMSEEEERSEIGQAIATYREAFGRPPAGWMGPEGGESPRTLQMLAAEGIEFVLDWPNDDTPYLYATEPPILSIPYQWELDDVDLLWSRNISVQKYPRIIGAAYDGLAQARSASTRVLGLHIHPWLLGQPARIRHLEAALEHIRHDAQADFRTVTEIATVAREQLTQAGAPPPAPLP